jgi:hypothetical protein
MRDIKSLLMILLSVGLVCTWTYHLYDKSVYSRRRTEVYIKDSVAVAEGIRDSLQKIYTGTINALDTRLDSTTNRKNSLQDELADKLEHIRKLKQEINAILGKKTISDAELGVAQSKINELQEVIDGLKHQNSSMEEEKQRLTLVMEQMNGDISGLQQGMTKLAEENRILTDKINLASIFVASELHLTAVTVKGPKEEETSQAKKAEKLLLSFVLQNNVTEYTGAEVYVVVIGPDGETLQNEGWESKSFDTNNEGKKDYTLKLRLDYEKGEQNRKTFSLSPDKYEKGNYLMQIYHKGYMIGQVTMTLS